MKTDSILTDRQTKRQTFLGVIIPVYNATKYLEDAVESVLRQPNKDLVLVIVNDGSTDSSAEIAERIADRDERVILLNQDNQGVSAARNNGIEYCIEANVKYIAFLDADDMWAKDFYTTDLMQQMVVEQYDAYHFTWYTANESMTRGRKFVSERNVVYPAKNARFGSHFCSYLYRAELFCQHQIRFPVGIRAQEDETFRYIFMTLAVDVKAVDIPIFAYRSNNSSVCHTKFDATSRYFQDVIPAWKWAVSELKRLSATTGSVQQADMDGCLTMCKTFLSEYIETAAQQGISVKSIKSQLESSEYTKLYENNSVWVDEFSMKRWNRFQNETLQFWVKCRTKGIVLNLLKRARNLPFVQKNRYPINHLQNIF